MNWLSNIIEFFERFAFFTVVQPDEWAVLTRLGHVRREFDPGFYWVWPIIEKVDKTPRSEQIIDMPTQTLLTFDKKPVAVSASLRYKVDDAGLALYRVSDYDNALLNMAMGMLQQGISCREINDLKCVEIEDDFLDCVNDYVNDWGLDVLDVRITHLVPIKPIALMNID